MPRPSSRETHERADARENRGRRARVLRDARCAPDDRADPRRSGRTRRPEHLVRAHWNRILRGELYARVSRPEWSILLARTFETDVKRCARCGGRLNVSTIDPRHRRPRLNARKTAPSGGRVPRTGGKSPIRGHRGRPCALDALCAQRAPARSRRSLLCCPSGLVWVLANGLVPSQLAGAPASVAPTSISPSRLEDIDRKPCRHPHSRA